MLPGTGAERVAFLLERYTYLASILPKQNPKRKVRRTPSRNIDVTRMCLDGFRLRSDEEIQSRFRVPEPLAAFYARRAPFSRCFAHRVIASCMEV